MDIEDIRRDNLRALLRKHGTQAALSEVIDVPPSYISRLLSRGRNRKHLKEDLARKIEKTAGLPHLWLDRSDASPAELPPAPWRFRARYDKLSPKDQAKIDQAIDIMLSLCESGGQQDASKKRAA